jgi:hypothetical protein
MDVKEWLIRWAADNIHEGYTDSEASMEKAAADCLNAAEAEGVPPSQVIEAADGDLAAYLRDFKIDNAEGD